jgi:hypothetical protein
MEKRNFVCEGHCKPIEEMTLKELRDVLESQESICIITDGDGNEVSPSEFIQATQRKRKRQKKNGAYHPASYWANLVGIHEDTFRRKLERIKSGVVKEVHSGRNRKTYVVRLYSKAAVKQVFPKLEI